MLEPVSYGDVYVHSYIFVADVVSVWDSVCRVCKPLHNMELT